MELENIVANTVYLKARQGLYIRWFYTPLNTNVYTRMCHNLIYRRSTDQAILHFLIHFDIPNQGLSRRIVTFTLCYGQMIVIDEKFNVFVWLYMTASFSVHHLVASFPSYPSSNSHPSFGLSIMMLTAYYHAGI